MLLLLRARTVKLYCSIVLGLMLGGIVLATSTKAPLRGRLTLGTSEALRQYLLPYAESFTESHDGVYIDLVVTGQAVESSTALDLGIDALVVTAEEAKLLLEATGLRPTRSFDALFAAVCSPFSDVKELGVTDLARSSIATYMGNPTDSMLPLVMGETRAGAPGNPLGEEDSAGGGDPSSGKKPSDGYEELVKTLFTDPTSLSVIPVSRLRPGVRPIPLRGESPYQLTKSGYLSRRIVVLEAASSLVPARIDRWFKLTGPHHHPHHQILIQFLCHIESVDESMDYSEAARISAVGDVMLNRGVSLEIGRNGVTYPFEETRQVLRSAEVAFANLECPISDEGQPLNMFRADPDSVVALTYAGFDVLSVANNHVLDYGDPALLETLRILNEAEIRGVGAGSDLNAAREPAVISVGETTIAFLAYTELWFCYTKTNRRCDATDASPGMAPADPDYIVADVHSSLEKADLVVVSIHWGEEYNHESSARQIELAHLAIDAGASVVLGHHPHVLQGIELYRGGIILYSMGNFVFDICRPSTHDTAIFSFLLADHRLIGFSITPCVIVASQPRIAGQTDRERILSDLGRYSATLCNPNR